MKHIKSIFEYGYYQDDEEREDGYDENNEDEDEFEERVDPTEDLPTTSYHEIAYHGTAISKEHGGYLFSSLDEGESDWNAVWVTKEESIAESYSQDKMYGHDDVLQVVYKLQLDVDDVAEIDYSTSQEIIDYFGYQDFRDCIGDLRNYNGWVVTGSIGRTTYEDIALFGSYSADIFEVKLLIDGEWTEFMSFSEANDMAEELGFIEE